MGLTRKHNIVAKAGLPLIFLLLVALAVAAGLLLIQRTARTQVKRVLLISIDTCRADYLSCYGFDRSTTPNIDDLATESIVFTNAISPVPITLPAHASMLTGTTPPYHGVHDNVDYRLGPAAVTLAEMLQEKGFTTGAIVSAFVMNSKLGLDQGFATYNDRFTTFRNTLGFSERPGDETTSLALQWLDENEDDNFFLFLHYYDPHASYDPPAPFAERFADNLYAGEIAFSDHCIGQVIDKLKQLDLYDSTLIVVTSDHGEMLGEHGENSHAYFIYQSALRVPLIFKMPGIRSAQVNETVGLIDIVPTICSALDIETPPHAQGLDLSAHFGPGDGPRDRAFYCESFTPTKYYDAAPLLGLVTPAWKYIHTANPELYHLADDPRELVNLTPKDPQRTDAFQRQLEEILQSTVRADAGDNKVQLDAEALARIESLGYIGDSINEDFKLDQNHDKLDPKDLIAFHTVWSRIRTDRIAVTEHDAQALASADKYREDKRICTEFYQQHPQFFAPHLCLGKIAMLENDFASAVPYLDEALRLKPDQSLAHDLLGRALARLGRLDEATPHLYRAIDLNPDSPVSHNSLGTVLAHQGKLDSAIKQFELALSLDPTAYHTHLYLGKAYADQGQLDEAARHYQESLRINPDQAHVHNSLAQVYYRRGDRRDAVASLTAAIRLEPNWPAALNNLARIKATADDPEIRDPQEAIRLAQRACQITDHQDPTFLMTLARAYAAADDFPAAIQTAQTALDLARTSGQEERASQIQPYIERYQEQLTR